MFPSKVCHLLKTKYDSPIFNSQTFENIYIVSVSDFIGYYYQAEILGQQVTWVVTHAFAYEHPQNVDLKLMSIFVEFYTTMLGFVNYRLYHNLNVMYPPTLVTSVASAILKSEKDGEGVPQRQITSGRWYGSNI